MVGERYELLILACAVWVSVWIVLQIILLKILGIYPTNGVTSRTPKKLRITAFIVLATTVLCAFVMDYVYVSHMVECAGKNTGVCSGDSSGLYFKMIDGVVFGFKTFLYMWGGGLGSALFFKGIMDEGKISA